MTIKCTACRKNASPHTIWKGKPYHFGCVPQVVVSTIRPSTERAEYGHSDPWNSDDLEHLDGMLEDRGRES